MKIWNKDSTAALHSVTVIYIQRKTIEDHLQTLMLNDHGNKSNNTYE